MTQNQATTAETLTEEELDRVDRLEERLDALFEEVREMTAIVRAYLAER